MINYFFDKNIIPFVTGTMFYFLISPHIIQIINFPYWHPHQPILFQLFLSGLVFLLIRSFGMRKPKQDKETGKMIWQP